jgi:serine phosphatase RsbU (regulator of sigma subunit)/CHASE1-domain containing sensor protein
MDERPEHGRASTLRSALRRFAPVIVTVLVGTGLAVAAFVELRRTERLKAEVQFEGTAVTFTSSLWRGIEVNVNALYSIRSLHAASERVDRDEFREFVIPLLKRLPSVQAFEWIPRVTDSERGELEAKARLESLPSFQFTVRNSAGAIVREGRREEYFPVYYVEPLADNERALGFDEASDPARLEAILRARDSGSLIVSERISLVQKGQHRHGVLMILPIYRNGAPTDSEAARRQSFLGVVMGVFRLGELVDNSLSHLKPRKAGIDVHLFDATARGALRFLYSTAVSPSEEQTVRQGLHFTDSFDLGGRRWEAICSPTSDRVAAGRTYEPWGVLLIGLLFTGLLAAHMVTNITHTARVEGLVRERTAELRLANQELTATNRSLELANRRFAQELELAQRVQRRLLPSHFPRSDRIAFGSIYLACEAVGGDIYDVFPIDDSRIGLYIADVSGHGLSAALIGATLKMSVDAMKPRAHGDGGAGPHESILTRPRDLVLALNEILSEYLERDKFITLLYAVISLPDKTVTLCNAAHTWPIWWHAAERRAELIETNSGLPINYVTESVLREQRLHLAPGDKFVLYTDGLIDRLSPGGESYGDEHLTRAVAAHGDQGAQDLVSTIKREIDEFAEGAPNVDDVALVVAEFLRPEALPASEAGEEARTAQQRDWPGLA